MTRRDISFDFTNHEKGGVKDLGDAFEAPEHIRTIKW